MIQHTADTQNRKSKWFHLIKIHNRQQNMTIITGRGQIYSEKEKSDMNTLTTILKTAKVCLHPFWFYKTGTLSKSESKAKA